jgi:hypothetical protein
MAKLVCGVGINDGKYPAKVNGKPTKVWQTWRGLLGRCYDPKYQRENPTYRDCQPSENFKNYSYFHEWCENQVGFGQQDFQLDKDLIFKGNKLYSEDTCLFLPSELNKLLVTRKGSRGNLPLGVSTNKGRFVARCGVGTYLHLGCFNTPKEAFNAYKEVKEPSSKLKPKSGETK